jgi:hypothetical protein
MASSGGNFFLEYAAGNLVRRVAVIGRGKVKRLDDAVHDESPGDEQGKQAHTVDFGGLLQPVLTDFKVENGP